MSKVGFIGRIGQPYPIGGPWYLSNQYAAIATDGTVVYPSYIDSFITNQYAKGAYNGVATSSTFAGNLENFTRASTATYFDATGALQTAAINEPRFTYDPATLQPLGLLVEESRTNLFDYSQDLTQGWFRIGLTPTSSTNVTSDNALSKHDYFKLVSVVSGTTYTMWFVFTPKTQSIIQLVLPSSRFGNNAWANFDLTNGTIGTEGTVGIGKVQKRLDGTVFCSITATCTSTGSSGCGFSFIETLTDARDPTFTGDNTKNLDVIRGQTEAGATGTSYIPTAGSTVTRAKDEPYTTDMTWFNPNEGSFIVLSYTGDGTPLGFGNSSGSNRGQIIDTASENGFYGIDSAGNSTDPKTTTGLAYGIQKCTAMSYRTNYTAAFANGVKLGQDTGTWTTWAPTRLAIGRRYAGSDIYGNQPVSRVLYYPKCLTDAELQRLTV